MCSAWSSPPDFFASCVYAAATGRYDADASRAVLVRPDGHVAALLRGGPTSAGPTLRAAVDRALGRSVEALDTLAG